MTTPDNLRDRLKAIDPWVTFVADDGHPVIRAMDNDEYVDAVLAVLEGWVPPQLEQVGWEWRYADEPNVWHFEVAEPLQGHHGYDIVKEPVFRLRVEGERE